MASKMVLALALLAMFPIFLPVTPSTELDAVESQPITKFVPNEMIVGFENITGDVLSHIKKSGGVVLEQTPALGAVRVYVPSSIEDAFVAAVKSKQGFSYIERNALIKLCHIPNDPYWDVQWSMRKIQANSSWDIHKGKSYVLVAIIDTGIDYMHDDLSGRYVPLGKDWYNKDNDPMDDFGHGTHCAGIAAAMMDNNIGVTGVAQVSLMAEKLISKWDNWTSAYDAGQSIMHSVGVGADVISMSWSIPEEASEFLGAAVAYAWKCGSILVASAGNKNTSVPRYPAAYPEVIAVSATDRYDEKASYSNYGDWIELSAPGGDWNGKILSTDLNNSYSWKDGTSMAVPHVSGLAALVWSYNYSLTNQQVREHLRSTADDLGEPGKDQYYGYGRINAYRALDELGPPGPLEDPPLCSVVDPVDGQEINDVHRVKVNATDDKEVSSVKLLIDEGGFYGAGDRWIDVTGNFDGTYYYYDWNTTTVPLGSHTLLARATDNASLQQWSPQVAVTVTIIDGHDHGNVNYPGSYFHSTYIELGYGIDLQVDQTDLDLMGLAYGTVVSESWGVGDGLYNPDANINGDERVDMRDIAICGKNYGKSYEQYWDGYKYLNKTLGGSVEETIDFYNRTDFVLLLGQEKYVDGEKVVDTYSVADWEPRYAFPISHEEHPNKIIEEGWFYSIYNP